MQRSAIDGYGALEKAQYLVLVERYVGGSATTRLLGLEAGDGDVSQVVRVKRVRLCATGQECQQRRQPEHAFHLRTTLEPCIDI